MNKYVIADECSRLSIWLGIWLVYSDVSEGKDAASQQLPIYAAHSHAKGAQFLTSEYGVAVDSITSSLTAGRQGPLLVEDTSYHNEIAHFNRERIPERVVHAKGAGAFGYFVVTGDITDFTKASLFSHIGKKTLIAVRFSFVTGELGAADTTRDPRGFAIKFYTDEGIWDLVGNNTPIFFIRDPILFPSFIHSQKRNPKTNLRDANMVWDFVSLRPETIHQILRTYSDNGTPDGYRHMHGYGSHTFKLVNHERGAVYCKFHYRTNQGIRNLTASRAAELAGTDPDYATRDLYNAIATNNTPSWTFYVQIMSFDQAITFRWNPLDVTKIWPEDQFPLIEVGKLVLNENPSNFFQDVEQMAFSPAQMVPGIEPSLDKLLQGRLFAYNDAHLYRLGVNHHQIPVNNAYGIRVANYHQAGHHNTLYRDGGPNYYPNSFGGPNEVPEAKLEPYVVPEPVVVRRYNTSEDDNYSQARMYWLNELDDAGRSSLVDNVVASLKLATPTIRKRTVQVFHQVSSEISSRLRFELAKLNNKNGIE